jgi:hypothetical protein
MNKIMPVSILKKHKPTVNVSMIRQRSRNYALVVLRLATDAPLRCLLALRWEDVYDFDHGSFKEQITVHDKLSGKFYTIELHEEAKEALATLFHNPEKRKIPAPRPRQYIFQSRRRGNKKIKNNRALNITKQVAIEIMAKGNITTQSLSKIRYLEIVREFADSNNIKELFGSREAPVFEGDFI